MRWAGHVACMWENNAYRVWVGKPEGKILLSIPRRSSEVSIINMGFKDMDRRAWIG
jgi:hypothetical protein